jgi:hypothetical protein
MAETPLASPPKIPPLLLSPCGDSTLVPPQDGERCAVHSEEGRASHSSESLPRQIPSAQGMRETQGETQSWDPGLSALDIFTPSGITAPSPKTYKLFDYI